MAIINAATRTHLDAFVALWRDRCVLDGSSPLSDDNQVKSWGDAGSISDCFGVTDRLFG